MARPSQTSVRFKVSNKARNLLENPVPSVSTVILLRTESIKLLVKPGKRHRLIQPNKQTTKDARNKRSR